MRAILLTGFAALSTLFAGWLALRARKHIHLLLGFGASVLLGATFFDLLPEAIEAAGEGGLTSREILALTVVGFLIFYLGQRFLSLQHCPHHDCGPDRHVGRMSALGLIAHSSIDGASIAASMMISWRMGLIVGWHHRS
jgi:zinc and cadmium transporter